MLLSGPISRHLPAPRQSKFGSASGVLQEQGSGGRVGASNFSYRFVEAFRQSLPNQRRIGSVEAAITLASNYRQPRQLDVQD